LFSTGEALGSIPSTKKKKKKKNRERERKWKQGMTAKAYCSSRKLKKEDHELEASLGYTVRSCLISTGKKKVRKCSKNDKDI
jgi:hypothetical protein